MVHRLRYAAKGADISPTLQVATATEKLNEPSIRSKIIKKFEKNQIGGCLSRPQADLMLCQLRHAVDTIRWHISRLVKDYFYAFLWLDWDKLDRFFKKMGHSGLFFFIFRLFNTVDSKHGWIRTAASGIGSDCSTNWATTTARFYFWCQIGGRQYLPRLPH